MNQCSFFVLRLKEDVKSIKSKTGAWEFLNIFFQMAPDLFTKHYLVPQIELQAIGPLQFPTTQIHVADYNK